MRPWWLGFDNAKQKDDLILFYSEGSDRWEALKLTRKDAAKMLPRLIDDLVAADPCLRSTAEFHLRRWTGVSLAHEWSGHQSNRPTLEEGRNMRWQWLDWWKRYRDTFLHPPGKGR